MFKFKIYLDDTPSQLYKNRPLAIRRPENWIFIGIPGVIATSFLFVMAQKIAPERFLIAVFVPVNESIWEHMKLTLYPVALWWTVYFSVRSERYRIHTRKWFTAAYVSWTISLIGIPIMYYTYTGSLGIYSEFMNVSILFVVVIIAQLYGLYIYKRTKGWPIVIPVIIFLVTVIGFTLFTFHPPHFPIFCDPVTGEYGVSSTKTN